MAAVFAGLRRRLPPSAAYTIGFAVYWLGWCLAFPVWVLGAGGVVAVVRRGRRAGPLTVLAGIAPVVGAVVTQLLPNRRLVDPAVAAVMVGTAAVNALGEEVLWRGCSSRSSPATSSAVRCGH
jgi:hypothetical protein